MRIQKTSSEKVTVFLQPNQNVIPENMKNRQLLENNQIYYKQTVGTFEVPTDWTVYIIYNYNNGFGWPLSGSIHLEAWVEDLKAEDAQKITKEWRPTEVIYLTP